MSGNYITPITDSQLIEQILGQRPAIHQTVLGFGRRDAPSSKWPFTDQKHNGFCRRAAQIRHSQSEPVGKQGSRPRRRANEFAQKSVLRPTLSPYLYPGTFNVQIPGFPSYCQNSQKLFLTLNGRQDSQSEATG